MENNERPILEEAADIIKKKKDLLVNSIRSKDMIEKYLHGKLDKEELAYALADDKELRKTTDHVVEGIINPEPVRTLKEERDPVGIDLVHGFSTFWKEMNEPIEEKVNAAADVRDVLNKVNVATDISESPKMREDIYKDLGLDEEKIDKLIPQSEKDDYTKALEDYYKDEHMNRLNLKDKDMLDVHDEERINNLVDDSMSMFNSGYDQIPSGFSYGNEQTDGYVEEYGMTAEELNRVFADAKGDDVYDYPPYDELNELENYPTMHRAINNVESMYNDSLEDNMRALSELESVERALPDEGFSNDDLEDLNSEYLDYLSQSETPSLSDDDLLDLEDDNHIER